MGREKGKNAKKKLGGKGGGKGGGGDPPIKKKIPKMTILVSGLGERAPKCQGLAPKCCRSHQESQGWPQKLRLPKTSSFTETSGIAPKIPQELSPNDPKMWEIPLKTQPQIVKDFTQNVEVFFGGELQS